MATVLTCMKPPAMERVLRIGLAASAIVLGSCGGGSSAPKDRAASSEVEAAAAVSSTQVSSAAAIARLADELQLELISPDGVPAGTVVLSRESAADVLEDLDGATTLLAVTARAPWAYKAVFDTLPDHGTVAIKLKPGDIVRSLASDEFPVLYFASGNGRPPAHDDGDRTPEALESSFDAGAGFVFANLPVSNFTRDADGKYSVEFVLAIARGYFGGDDASQRAQALAIAPRKNRIPCPLKTSASAGCTERSQFNPNRSLAERERGPHRGIDLVGGPHAKADGLQVVGVTGSKVTHVRTDRQYDAAVKRLRSCAPKTAASCELSNAEKNACKAALNSLYADAYQASCGAGRMVELTKGSFKYRYLHLKSVGVSRGGGGGGAIGTVGNSGCPGCGSHLHFEIWTPTGRTCKEQAGKRSCAYVYAAKGNNDPFNYLIDSFEFNEHAPSLALRDRLRLR